MQTTKAVRLPEDADTEAEPTGSSRTGAAIRRYLPVGLLGLGLVGFFAAGLHRYLAIEQLAVHRESLAAFVRQYSVLSAAVYVLVYVAAAALSIPSGLALTVLGGFLFGTWFGTLYAVVGASVGAVLLFVAARTAFRDLLLRRAGPWLARFEAGFRANSLSYLLALRLLPVVPFWLTNLVPAFLGIPVRTFIVATVVGIVPGTLVWASVGNGLGALIADGRPIDARLILDPNIALPLVGLSVLSLLPALYRAVKGRVLRGRL